MDTLTKEEKTLYQHTFDDSSEDYGVLNTFWAGGDDKYVGDAVIRYYVDNETIPSITFTPREATVAALGAETIPYDNRYFGKGAHSSGFNVQHPVPFKSVRVTYQLNPAYWDDDTPLCWFIVRGSSNIPVKLGNIELPSSARLKLHTQDVIVKSLDFVDFLTIDAGAGMMWMMDMSVESQNLNFMEGCFHIYDNKVKDFPGQLISTGMEDYFQSAFYFDAGVFASENVGAVHLVNNEEDEIGEFSGYRIHELDPIIFNDGFRFQWRNGDSRTETGLKCVTAEGGKVIGTPSDSRVLSHVWYYTW